MTDKNREDDNISDEERRMIEEIQSQAKASATTKLYGSLMKQFSEWLIARGASDELPISPGLVQVYLGECSKKHKRSTIRSINSAIRYAHSSKGFDSPTDHPEVKDLMKGIARKKKGEPVNQAPGLSRNALARIIETACNPRPRGRGGMETELTALKRGQADIALLHVQFDGMLRISEALDLCWGNIQYNPDGKSGTAAIGYSKTDPEGAGAVQWMSPGAMAALEAIRPSNWRPEDKIFEMSDATAERHIEHAGIAAGLDVKLSGHSARVGMTQELVKANIHVAAIMKAGRWKGGDMVNYYSRNILAGEGGVAHYYRGSSETPTQSIIYRPSVVVRAAV